MKTLNEHLIQYARYHRDARNIATHFVGIPMIVFSLCVLLSRPAPGGLPMAWPAALAMVLFHARLDARYGAVMALLMAACLTGAAAVAAWATPAWLALGVGLFVVGWVFQFVGHFWEGRKPAFVDDLVGLVVGPLFVLAEAGFLLGWRPEVQQAITEAAGPVRRGGAAAAGGR